jgi:hypothetical protein
VCEIPWYYSTDVTLETFLFEDNDGNGPLHGYAFAMYGHSAFKPKDTYETLMKEGANHVGQRLLKITEIKND